MRPRGRWGDLIIAFIPIYWCTNILINSNSLLKLIEWQDQSGILTLRVRGKQWYWVYKLDSVFNRNKSNFLLNIGHKSSINLAVLYFNKNNNSFNSLWFEWGKTFIQNKISDITSVKPRGLLNRAIVHINISDIKINLISSSSKVMFFLKNNPIKVNSKIIDSKLNFFFKIRKTPFIYNLNAETTSVSVKSNLVVSLNKSNKQAGVLEIFFKSDASALKKHRYYLTLRQKPVKEWFSTKSNTKLMDYNIAFFKQYQNLDFFFRSNSFLSYSYLRSNRLLNTTSLLVLPTNKHISIISNSFDVVHSWFIPGLGLKIDCVPGRSTHHSLYIDVPGFYYGQCAEICGRFHHHMPIKICALVFEHFLIWWNHYFFYLNITDNFEDSISVDRSKYSSIII